MIFIFLNFQFERNSNYLGAPIFRQKIGIFVYVEAIFFEA